MSWPMISRGSDYSGDHWLWREASLATELATFLGSTGARLLNDLDANALHVRVIDARPAGDDERPADEHTGDATPRELQTIVAIRRGVVGVTQPGRGRHEISGAVAQRIKS